ncbi:hypothetical protein PM082_007169 [Marasmius tenuissimus]|nr:hypothetical protein PM082_007169 [Marasmius tenuissimus]
MDPHDRKHNYETACAWLALVATHGHLYRRVKEDIQDPDDTKWTSKDPCPVGSFPRSIKLKDDLHGRQVYLTKGFNLDEACLLTCELYYANCAIQWRDRCFNPTSWDLFHGGSALLNSGANDSSSIGPICRRDSYFVSTKWIFVHNAAARDRAKKRIEEEIREGEEGESEKEGYTSAVQPKPSRYSANLHCWEVLRYKS